MPPSPRSQFFNTIEPGHRVNIIGGVYKEEIGFFVRWPNSAFSVFSKKKSAFVRLLCHDNVDDIDCVCLRIDNVFFENDFRFPNLRFVFDDVPPTPINAPVVDLNYNEHSNTPVANAVMDRNGYNNYVTNDELNAQLRLIGASINQIMEAINQLSARIDRLEISTVPTNANVVRASVVDDDDM
jgi:hypothetical protein